MLPSRRSFITLGVAAGALTSGFAARRDASAQPRTAPQARVVQTPVLNVGFEESGDVKGFPSSCCTAFRTTCGHGTRCRRRSRARATGLSFRYLRGYGPTRFREPSIPRMAEQAAIGQDLIDLADALGCRDLRWLATTGVAAPRALQRRFIRGGCELSC